MNTMKPTTKPHTLPWKYATLSPDNHYLTLRNDAGDVSVYDMTKRVPENVLQIDNREADGQYRHVHGLFEEPEKAAINGAAVYGLNLYSTRQGDNVLYERPILCKQDDPLIVFNEYQTVQLVDVIRGMPMTFILSVKKAKDYRSRLVAYDKETNSVLYELLLQHDYMDAVRIEKTSNLALIAREYGTTPADEYEYDRLYIEAAIFDNNNPKMSSYIGRVTVENRDDSAYPKQMGDMKWPLIKWNEHIPSLEAFSSFGNFMLSTIKQQTLVISSLSGEIYRFIDISMFEDANILRFFYDEKEETLLVVTDTMVTKLTVPRVPEPVLKKFNDLYAAFPDIEPQVNESTKHSLERLFYIIMYAYGQPNKVYCTKTVVNECALDKRYLKENL